MRRAGREISTPARWPRPMPDRAPKYRKESTAAKSDQTYQGTAANSPRAGICGEVCATDSSVEATIKLKVAQRRQKIEMSAAKVSNRSPTWLIQVKGGRTCMQLC